MEEIGQEEMTGGCMRECGRQSCVGNREFNLMYDGVKTGKAEGR